MYFRGTASKIGGRQKMDLITGIEAVLRFDNNLLFLFIIPFPSCFRSMNAICDIASTTIMNVESCPMTRTGNLQRAEWRWKYNAGRSWQII